MLQRIIHLLAVINQTNTGDAIGIYPAVQFNLLTGNGGELFDGITIENIQIPQTVASFMGVNDFGDQSKFKHLAK